MASKTQALVPSKRSLGLHVRRLIQEIMGATPEQIAKAEKVSVEAVRSSLRQAQIYRERNSLEFANLAIGETIIDLSGDVKTSLRTALRAKKAQKRFYRKNGRLEEKTVIVQDHEIQLKAVDQYKGLVEAIQPKGGKININAQATAQAQASSYNESTYQDGAEELIDTIRSKVQQHNLLPRELGTIKDDDADIIEGDPEDISADDEEPSLSEEGSGSEKPAEMSP